MVFLAHWYILPIWLLFFGALIALAIRAFRRFRH
jgi:hypothetical protein